MMTNNNRQTYVTNPRLLEILLHAVTWLLIFGFPLVMMEYNSFVRWNGMDYLRHLRTPLAFGVVFYFNYAWIVSAYLFKQGWKMFDCYCWNVASFITRVDSCRYDPSLHSSPFDA